jgi:hypothetical protein
MPPEPTTVELSAIARLARAQQAARVAIGTGRDAVSTAAADLLEQLLSGHTTPVECSVEDQAVDERSTVDRLDEGAASITGQDHAPAIEVVRVDWPAQAASWLRPARRLTAPDIELCIVLDNLAGSAQILRRLAEQPGWHVGNIITWSAIRRPALLTLFQAERLDGLRGTTATGETWTLYSDRFHDVTGRR